MCRHCVARGELYDRIKMGQIGDIIAAARLPRARAGRRHASSRRSRRTASELLYQIQQLPRVPVGQSAVRTATSHPQHRRVLLDEGRLAGARPRRSAGGTTAARWSIRTSTPTRSSTRSPTAPSCSSRAATSTAATNEFASYAHGTKGSALISTQRPHAGQVPHLQGPGDRRQERRSGRSRPTSRTRISSSGTT